MNKIILILLSFFLIPKVCVYSQNMHEGLSIKDSYENTFKKVLVALDSTETYSFKKIIFIVENTYLKYTLKENEFNNQIQIIKSLILDWINFNPISNYKYKDSIDFHKNYGIYKILTDTTSVRISKNLRIGLLPYMYDFNDYNGSQDWSNMFVTKLLATHKGNCHSLPYLYKILADELGATCWLSLAPNHIYIKNRCKKIGWYNTELTSGTFPIDAWIMASGYMPLQAIQNKLYMDTLSNQQAIALCVLDLAKGYEHQTKNYTDGFILKCCELVLKYHPTNPMALLLKAETLKQVFLHEQAIKYPKPTITFNEMQAFYVKLFDLGYREMPEKMYMNWLKSVTKEREKYNNKKLKATLQGK